MPKDNDEENRPCAGSAARRWAPAWLLRRPLVYADGKPRPILRGALHGVIAVVGTLLTLALLTEHARWRPFALPGISAAFTLKAVAWQKIGFYRYATVSKVAPQGATGRAAPGGNWVATQKSQNPCDRKVQVAKPLRPRAKE